MIPFRSDPAAPGPAVLVVHDSFGFLPHVRRAGERLAAAGFVAVAPDLYDGRSTTDQAEAALLMGALDQNEALQNLSQAIRELRDDPRVAGGRVGAVGFWMGGMLVLHLAEMGELDGAVAYDATLQPEIALRARS